MNSSVEVVDCGGQKYALLPGQYWHWANQHPGMLLYNAFIGKGRCTSVSVMQRMPGLSAAVSPYSMRVDQDAKEQIWEQVRVAEFANLPSRRGAIFLFDDRGTAERAGATWTLSNGRVLVEARVIGGSRLHRADTRWLDCTPDLWNEYARGYWSGAMFADPLPEVLVDGAAYFPGWSKPPFGLTALMGAQQ